MSISSISSSAPVYQPPQQDPVSQNFQQLAQALQSGDLSSAQAAYTTLTQNLPNKTADGASSQNTPFQQGLAALGTALQSGNLSGAQQALQTLQSQMKGAQSSSSQPKSGDRIGLFAHKFGDSFRAVRVLTAGQPHSMNCCATRGVSQLPTRLFFPSTHLRSIAEATQLGFRSREKRIPVRD
jgi:hypothetical protein